MTEFCYAVLPLDKAARRADIRRLPKAPSQLLDIALAQRHRETDGGFDRVAVILFRDKTGDRLVRRRIDLATGRSESEERFPSGAVSGMTLIDSVLDPNLMPRYLFAAADGSVHFFRPDFGEHLPVRSPGGKPVKPSFSPVLLLASEFSKRPGTYVRYIEDGRRFAFVKVR